MIKTILSSLFVAITSGLILYHIFGVGKANSYKKNWKHIDSVRPLIEQDLMPDENPQAIEESPVYRPLAAKVDPEAIFLKIKAEKNSLIKADIGHSYNNLSIIWNLELGTVERTKNDNNQRLIILVTKHTHSYVTCWIDIEKYPELKSADEGSSILLKGRISGIDNYSHISVSNPKIEVL
jgi:hypothetical protein